MWVYLAEPLQYLVKVTCSMPYFWELCKLWPQFLDQNTWQPKITKGVSLENIEMPQKYTGYLRVPQISSSLSCCSTRSLASGQRFLIIMNSGALLLSAKGYWGPTDPDHDDLCDCPALWPFIQGFFHTHSLERCQKHLPLDQVDRLDTCVCPFDDDLRTPLPLPIDHMWPPLTVRPLSTVAF